MPETPAQKEQQKINYKSNSNFITCEKSEQVLDLVRQYLPKIEAKTVTKAELYRKIKALDSKLPSYNSFLIFLSHLDKSRKRRTGVLLNSLKQSLELEAVDGDKKVMRQFIDMIYSKIFAAGNAVISQELEDIKIQVENGIPLKEGQKKNIMQWFFKGVKGMQKDRALDISLEAGERAQSFMDTLMQGFQYGKVKKEDIIDGEVVPPNQLTPANAS